MDEVKRLRAAIAAYAHSDDPLVAASNFIASAIGAAKMESFRIAEHPQAANAQHYELPAALFAHALGPPRMRPTPDG
jgi:cyclopropane-fatty-acyl-phospholipid synthase